MPAADDPAASSKIRQFEEALNRPAAGIWQKGWYDVISEEQLQEKVLARLDLSREIGDDELTELIFRVLDEESAGGYIPLKKKAELGRELYNAFRRLDLLQDLIEDQEITEIMINARRIFSWRKKERFT